MRTCYLGLLVVLWACADPVASTLCACSPVEPAVEVRGTLVSATGMPQPGKRVRALRSPLPCTAFLEDGGLGPLTDSTGYVRLLVFGSPTDSLCVRFLMRDNIVGAPEQELSDTVRLRPTLPPYAIVTVLLVLPP